MSSDEETMTSATFSTVAAGDSANLDHDMDGPLRDESYKQFQHAMESATDTHVSTCKSTYFFDGGKRFISVSIPRHKQCPRIGLNHADVNFVLYSLSLFETNSSPRSVTPTSRQLL